MKKSLLFLAVALFCFACNDDDDGGGDVVETCVCETHGSLEFQDLDPSNNLYWQYFYSDDCSDDGTVLFETGRGPVPPTSVRYTLREVVICE